MIEIRKMINKDMRKENFELTTVSLRDMMRRRKSISSCMVFSMTSESDLSFPFECYNHQQIGQVIPNKKAFYIPSISGFSLETSMRAKTEA